MNPEALILRRCYPVPVTFADLRAAWDGRRHSQEMRAWHAALKQVTSALDEVYAVVDGREVRVAVVRQNVVEADCTVTAFGWGYDFRDLIDKADREGYWERPHEVRLDLSPRPVSHEEVARAVLVGQEALERGGVVRT